MESTAMDTPTMRQVPGITSNGNLKWAHQVRFDELWTNYWMFENVRFIEVCNTVNIVFIRSLCGIIERCSHYSSFFVIVLISSLAKSVDRLYHSRQIVNVIFGKFFIELRWNNTCSWKEWKGKEQQNNKKSLRSLIRFRQSFLICF